MTIQNENGKVIKNDSKSHNITVVGNPNIPSEDNDKDKNTDDDNSDFDRFKPNNSNHLNWLIAIYIILLFF